MKSCKGCKHYKKDERTRLIICEFGLHESYCEKDKEDFAIAELEKIKAEIKDMDWNVVSTIHGRKKEFISKEVIYKLLDNRISELKGENNE